MTNREIRWRTIRAAQNLTKLGIGSNDVIQVIASNHHYLAPLMFAALTIGAPINAIAVQFTKGIQIHSHKKNVEKIISTAQSFDTHSRYFTDEIVHMLKIAKPKLILCDFSILGNVRESLRQLQIDLPILTFDGSAEGVQNVEVLFDETNEESFEYELYNFIRYNTGTNLILCYIF